MKVKGSALSALSNNDLLVATRTLVGRSNEVTGDLIAHLAEVDARKLYLEQAQPSLFAWCVAELGCSEDVACNWIAVARSSRRYPAVLDALREGKVHLTGLRMLAPHLTEKGHRALLKQAAGKSKREIEELVARVAPRPAVPSSIRKLPGARSNGVKDGKGKNDSLFDAQAASGPIGNGAQAAAPLQAPAAAALGSFADGVTNNTDLEHDSRTGADHPSNVGAGPDSNGGHRPADGASRKRGRVEPLSDEAYKVTFTASRCLRDKIRRAKDLLGHQVQDGDLAEIIERGLDLLIEDTKKKRFAVGRKPRASKKRCSKKSDQKSAAAASTVSGAPGKTMVTEPCGKADKPKPLSSQPKPGDSSDRPRKSMKDKRRKQPSRHIPAEVRRAVIERDGERCTFVDDRGKRCPEKRRLEFDHAEGFARTGRHTVDGLRLRCRPHNQWEAESMYGRAFMEKKRGGKVSAPARVDSDRTM